VQGVGFRYAVKRLATGYEVVGWVRNLPDGRVGMLVASWDPDELQAFMQAILDSNLGPLIRDREAAQVTPPEGLRGFVIR
jgi:acylphosphatase